MSLQQQTFCFDFSSIVWKFKRMNYFLTFILSFWVFGAHAQRVESIHFHLYTDSLKKGTHNYINVDGKMSNGSWQPLTAKELDFKTDYGKFKGNDLVLPENPSVSKVCVTATLKADKQTTQQITIWIKQKPDPPLPVYSSEAEARKRK
mgnify:CR=1 FL=1